MKEAVVSNYDRVHLAIANARLNSKSCSWEHYRENRRSKRWGLARRWASICKGGCKNA